jgi:hypothetical protein
MARRRYSIKYEGDNIPDTPEHLAACKKYRDSHKDEVNSRQRKKREFIRKICLIHYGNCTIHLTKEGIWIEPPMCDCCGETTEEFLEIDHINGGGNKHLKSIHSNMPTWLMNNDFPEGYRVLCSNCNKSLGDRGYCPHKSKEVM